MRKNKEKLNKIAFRENLFIKREERATLIRCSEKCELNEYVFWWPTRFIRSCEKEGYKTLLYKASDVFHVRKYYRYSNHEDSELVDLKVLPSSKIHELLQE